MINKTNLLKIIKNEKESEWIEYKSSYIKPDDIGTYISALSNGALEKGKPYAYLIFGIEDKTKNIIGTTFDYKNNVNENEPLINYLARKVEPNINFKFYEFMIEDKKVVVLEIPKADGRIVSYNDIRYIRIGSSKEKLSKYPEKEQVLFERIFYKKLNISNIESNYQDLTFNKFLIYCSTKNIFVNMNTYKESFNFLTEDGKYNYLAQLMSDNSHVNIRFAIFSGTDKTTKLYSVKEFGNDCLLYSLDKILDYLDTINILKTEELNRKVIRDETPLYDLAVVREAVINALLHNKWITGEAPTFNLFSDRLEIISQGGLSPYLTLEKFFSGESHPINKDLSVLFIQLKISEKTGRGVPKIIKKYHKKAYDIDENRIKLTIPFNTKKQINIINQYNELNKTCANIIYEMRNDCNITVTGMSINLKLSRKTITKWINYLKKENYIERIGSGNLGYWKVNEDK